MSAEDLELNISISGNNNDSNLLLHSTGGAIGDNNEIISKNLDKPKLYFFGDNLSWSKSARFKLGAFGSSTAFGPYSDPIFPEMISEYLIGEPINNFYIMQNPMGSGNGEVSIGPKLYNNNNFGLIAGGIVLDYIESKAVPFKPFSAIEYNMKKNLQDLKDQGKKINENDYVYVGGIFMDLVALGFGMYPGDINGDGINNLLDYYNINFEGTKDEKYTRAVQLVAEEYIKFVELLKKEGAKKIIFFLYKQDSLQQMPVISNGDKPDDVPPFAIAAGPGKATVFDKQAEFFDKIIREAFANDPLVYVYDHDITKMIEQAGTTSYGGPVFLNTKVEIMLVDENLGNVSNPYGSVAPTIDAINARLAENRPFVQQGGYNSGTAPPGSNVWNSVWYTGEHTTASFNVYVAEDLVGKVRDFFKD